MQETTVETKLELKVIKINKINKKCSEVQVNVDLSLPL